MASEEQDEIEVNDDGNDSDDPDDLTFDVNNPTGKKVKRTRTQKSYKKKVEHKWTDDEIFNLIKAVEPQRSLWDFSSPEYKLPKDLVWEQVANAVSAEVNDCKAKWGNLRVTFNSNMNKYRAKKSGQSVDESYTVGWKFFKSMMFLEASKVSQSTKSTSSMELVYFLFAF